MSIRRYRGADMTRIKARQDFAALMNEDSFGGGEPDRKTTWTLTRGRWEILACGGFVRERSGVYGLWGYCAGNLTRREWVEIARKTRHLITILFFAGARRVHAMARADHAEAVKFLMHLGLRNDMNRLVAAAPDGGDFVILAAIKGLRT